MAYNGKPFFKIPRPLLLAGGVEVKTIIDGIALTDKDSLFQIIDSGSADQNIILTNNLDVQNQSATSLVLLAPNEVAVLVSDSSVWSLILNVNNL